MAQTTTVKRDFNAVERFPLPPHPTMGEQWADIERRPTREQMKAIERTTRRELRGDQAMNAEDWLILALTQSWQVYDIKGQEVPLLVGPLMDHIQGDLVQPLIDELHAVSRTVNRGSALQSIAAMLDNMAWSLSDTDAARMRDLVSEIQSLFGVAPPNASDQAAT